MKQPRARVRFSKAIEQAIENPGEPILFKEMQGTSALQTARKYNSARVDGDVDGLEWLVDGSNLYVRYAS